MQFDIISTLIISILILAIAGMAYWYFSWRSMLKEIAKSAQKLEVELFRRMDLIPLMIERVSNESNQESIQRLIEARRISMICKVGEAEKRNSEEQVMNALNNLINGLSVEIQKDVILADLKRDLIESNKKIEEVAQGYNSLIYSKFFLLSYKLFSRLSRVSREKNICRF